MSRPQKIHQPLKASFAAVLESVAMGGGAGKRAAIKLMKQNSKSKSASIPPKKKL